MLATDLKLLLSTVYGEIAYSAPEMLLDIDIKCAMISLYCKIRGYIQDAYAVRQLQDAYADRQL